MHHRKTYMYINFQQNRVSRTVKSLHTNLLAKIASCINLKLFTTNSNFKKYFRQASSDDVHMYSNFHPNRVGNQSKLCSQIYLQKRKLHKFANTNSNLKKYIIISVMHHRKTYIFSKIGFNYLIFSKIGLIYQSKQCTLIFLQNNVSYINLQLAIQSLKITPFGHALPHNQNSGQFWDQSTY